MGGRSGGQLICSQSASKRASGGEHECTNGALSKIQRDARTLGGVALLGASNGSLLGGLGWRSGGGWGGLDGRNGVLREGVEHVHGHFWRVLCGLVALLRCD